MRYVAFILIVIAMGAPAQVEERALTAIGSSEGANSVSELYNPDTGEWGYPVLDLEEIMKQMDRSSNNLVVAFLDSGALFDHPWIKKQEIIAQKDFTGEGLEDQNGHGTSVLLTYIAQCIGCKHRLIVGKVLDRTKRGYPDQIVDGMMWAAENGADIINMSFCVPRSSWGSNLVCDAAKEIYYKYDRIYMLASECNDPLKRPSCPADAGGVIPITWSSTNDFYQAENQPID